MAHLPLYQNSITTSTGTGSLIYSTTCGSSGYTINLNEGTTDFFELVLAALGYDITYEGFTKLSKDERNQIIRDIKLKTII